MPTPSLTDPPITTEKRNGILEVKVGDRIVAIATPVNSMAPGFRNAWNVTLFDPQSTADTAVIAVDEDAANEVAQLFARLAYRAVAR